MGAWWVWSAGGARRRTRTGRALASMTALGLVWIVGLAAARAAPLDDLAVLRGGADDAGFEIARGTRRFEFPRDHGPHPRFRHEWWYFTGRLRAADGEQFGFELTFFRLGVAPAGAGEVVPRAGADAAAGTDVARPDAGAGALNAAGSGPGAGSGASTRSAWRARQVYAAHFAVTDLGRGVFHAHARYAREALGLGMAKGAPLEVRVQDWSLVEEPPQGGGVKSGDGRDGGAQRGVARGGAANDAVVRGGGAADGSAQNDAARWRLRADDGAYAINLQAVVDGSPVLNGDGGLSVKAAEPGAASWYYSMPRLPVSGTLTRDGRVLPVEGEVWLDREWGSGGLGAAQRGWDWYALQLSDGSALMLYTLRAADGRPDPHSAGTFVAADGRVRTLSASEIGITATRTWDSPRGGRYPAAWRVRVPALELDLDVTPVLADQELPTQPRYWEGAVDAKGTRAGRAVGARGYVELVGYANK